MKIVSISLHNFKKIADLELDIDGANIYLLGPNEAGKSSVLDAVWFALNPDKETPVSKIPKPLKEGAENGFVKIVVGSDNKKYTVIRKIKAGSDERKITITGEDGMKTEKVDMLDILIGYRKIDPFEFVAWGNTADGRRKQMSLIESLLSEGVRASLNTIKVTIITLEQSTEKLTKEKGSADVAMASLGISADDLVTYAKPIDHQAKMNELSAANAHNDEIKRRKQRLEDNNKTVERYEATKKEKELQIERLKQEIAGIQNDINATKEENFRLNSYIEDNEVVPTAGIEQEIATASSHNTKNGLVVKHAEHKAKSESSAAELAVKKAALEKARENRRSVIQGAKLPIDGLWFDDAQLYLGDVPMSEKQISTAQIMKLAFAIALATEKKDDKLKLLCIPRGESLDNKSIGELKEFLSENPGWQAFVEQVDRGKEQLTVEYFES